MIQRLGFRGFTGFPGRIAPLFVITDNDAGVVLLRGRAVEVGTTSQNSKPPKQLRERDARYGLAAPRGRRYLGHAKAPPGWFGVAGFQSRGAALRAGFSLRSRGST